MSSRIVVEIKFDRLPKLTKQVRERAALAVAKAAFDIEGQAKTLAPVDTGNLKNSIQTEPGESDLTKYVGPHTDYAIYVEYGTGRRGDPAVPHSDVAGMAPRPYMRPAAERVRPGFIAAMEQIADL